MDSLFTIRLDIAKDKKPVGLGSHTDTQPADTLDRIKTNLDDEGE